MLKVGDLVYVSNPDTKHEEEQSITFKKVEAHTGIDGNEEADKLAKQAVGLL